MLGKYLNAMVLVVIHTFRDKDGIETLRIISARKATKDFSLNTIINSLLKQDIEISKKLA